MAFPSRKRATAIPMRRPLSPTHHPKSKSRVGAASPERRQIIQDREQQIMHLRGSFFAVRFRCLEQRRVSVRNLLYLLPHHQSNKAAIFFVCPFSSPSLPALATTTTVLRLPARRNRHPHHQKGEKGKTNRAGHLRLVPVRTQGPHGKFPKGKEQKGNSKNDLGD